MLNVLVLGSSGMLGHVFSDYFKNKFQLHGTLKNSLKTYRNLSSTKINYFDNFDVLEENLSEKIIDDCKPHFIVNCIGITKQIANQSNKESINFINGEYPKIIEKLCKQKKTKLIQLSTDCVFSGKKGNYTEEDICDADDIYGVSKIKGEIKDSDSCLTLRKSTIGLEIKDKHGLIEWFLDQKEIDGYKNAIFSGLTSYELARVIEKIMIDFPQLHGLYNVSSNPINKYDLLRNLSLLLRKEIKINPFEDFFCDRSLNSSRFIEKTGYNPPSWERMLMELSKKILERDETKK